MDAIQMRRAIERKREGQALHADVWSAIVRAYVADRIDEAQMAALAMAVVLRGLDPDETLTLTRAMLESGERIAFPAAGGIVVDKHSSGGVADTVSLIAVPAAAAAGVRVAKLAGRALGHTGGTLDKLEALGARTDLPETVFVKQVASIGCAIAAQSERLVPADKKLYALRDRTGTIPSIGLIAASIVSKKLAGGATSIVYDVKAGAGAFLKTPREAGELAWTLVALTSALGRAARAFVTDMEEPLGPTIGSGLEGLEARDFLRATRRDDRLATLCERIGDALVVAGGGPEGSYARALAGGAAYESFERLLHAQGADVRRLAGLRAAAPSFAARAPRTGFVASVDAVALGECARDAIARAGPFAGITAIRRAGEPVEAGEPLAFVAGGDEAAARRVLAAFTVADEPPLPRRLVYDELGAWVSSGAVRSMEATR